MIKANKKTLRSVLGDLTALLSSSILPTHPPSGSPFVKLKDWVFSEKKAYFTFLCLSLPLVWRFHLLDKTGQIELMVEGHERRLGYQSESFSLHVEPCRWTIMSMISYRHFLREGDAIIVGPAITQLNGQIIISYTR